MPSYWDGCSKVIYNMLVKSSLGFVFYYYFNMPTINKTYLILSYLEPWHKHLVWGRRGRDCMVVGFKTTYAISVCHH